MTVIGLRAGLKMVTTVNGEDLALTVRMVREVAQLDSVLVRADSSSTSSADLTGFDQRRRNANGGHYIVAQDIERSPNTQTEQLFHGIPAVQVDTAAIIV